MSLSFSQINSLPTNSSQNNRDSVMDNQLPGNREITAELAAKVKNLASNLNGELVLVGLNHRTASVDIRERLALANYCTPENWAIPPSKSLKEVLILSTCNRVEILSYGLAEANLEQEILAHWCRTCKVERDFVTDHVYIYKGAEAIRHLFSVAASLDSMVLGEPQILGQLKSAYRKSTEAKTTGPILNRLLHKSFSVAKRIRNETAIASSAVSISYAAVALAKRIFGQMQEQSALLIGAGEMAELAATHLIAAGLRKIYIANRTFERAQNLAEHFHGQAIDFAEINQCLPKVDIVITSTGSTQPIINAEEIKPALKSRKNQPMFFIDIAVPRDVDPEVNNLDNVYLYDIDDLREVVEENVANRQEEARHARVIIDEEVIAFNHWLQGLSSQPTIRALLQQAENIVQMEVQKTIKIHNLDEKQRVALERMGQAIVHKILHQPLSFLKRNNQDQSQNLSSLNIFQMIFNLNAQEQDEDKIED